MSKTDVAVKDQAALAAAEQAQLEAELAQENQAASDTADLQIPLLKVGQALTNEVTEGDASAGEFINALTREGLGREVEFVVAFKQKGRFDHGNRKEGKRARKSYGMSVVPWSDDPYAGRPFAEHPDAEEQFAKRVNANEIPWGSGPRISTTYDFTGHVVSGLEEGEEPIPVCLSLMRMNSKAAKNWITILDAVLAGKYWDEVFLLSTEQKRGAEGSFYTVNVKRLRKTTDVEKQRAVQLAVALRKQQVEIVGDEDGVASTVQPEVPGGIAI